ncbi:MAG: aldehyde dehydrogenase family protein, partial [Pseudomonadota bacterium]
MTHAHREAVSDWFEGGAIASLINGEAMHGQGDEVVVEDPATGQVALTYRDGGAAVAEAALHAAENGGSHWRNLTASARGAVLFEASRLIRDRAEDLAQLEAA